MRRVTPKVKKNNKNKKHKQPIDPNTPMALRVDLIEHAAKSHVKHLDSRQRAQLRAKRTHLEGVIFARKNNQSREQFLSSKVGKVIAKELKYIDELLGG